VALRFIDTTATKGAGARENDSGKVTGDGGPAARHAAVAEFYACFNERRFADAATMFADDAVIEQGPFERPLTGGDGYLAFARLWTRGFPDATVSVERVWSRTPDLVEVELLALGTHIGPLDLGSGGLFKPTGASASLRLRQLLQFNGVKFIYSSLSFDLQEIVRQLVTVDEARLIEYTRRIHQLGEKLAAAESLVERRSIVLRLGSELDEARHVLRPYYHR
jgi:hypothetical protein